MSLYHPIADLLLHYATNGYAINTQGESLESLERTARLDFQWYPKDHLFNT